jgi:hypothetical protein
MSLVINFVMNFKSNLKVYHWITTSYARHKAADDCLEQLEGLTDRFMEVYIGKYGRPLRPANKKDGTVYLMYLDDELVVEFLNESIHFLMKELPKLLTKEDTDLINIRDDMVGAINNTKYLFTLR